MKINKLYTAIIAISIAQFGFPASALDSTSDCFTTQIPSTPQGASSNFQIDATDQNDAVNLEFWRTQCNVIDDGVQETETEVIMTVTPNISGRSNTGCYGVTFRQNGRIEHEDFDDINRGLTSTVSYEVDSSDNNDFNEIDYSQPFDIELSCLNNSLPAYNAIFGSDGVPSGGGSTIPQINDVTGLWYDPGFAGSGFNIIRAHNGITGYFFGYSNNGTPLWLTLEVVDDEIVLNDDINFGAYDPREGNGANFNQRPTDGTSGVDDWGKVILNFTSCNTARARLEGEDGIITLNMVKLATPQSLICN